MNFYKRTLNFHLFQNKKIKVVFYFDRYLKTALWTLFCGVQVCVCLSRVFIAAHFPHQVVAGVITGQCVSVPALLRQ